MKKNLQLTKKVLAFSAITTLLVSCGSSDVEITTEEISSLSSNDIEIKTAESRSRGKKNKNKRIGELPIRNVKSKTGTKVVIDTGQVKKDFNDEDADKKNY